MLSLRALRLCANTGKENLVVLRPAQACRCLAAALAQLGRDAEAGKAAVQILEMEPDFRISEWVARSGHWRSKVFIEGLRKAGLPE